MTARDNSDRRGGEEEEGEDTTALRSHSLLTVGEGCVHLICEYIRGFSTKGPTITREDSYVFDGAVALSRLSRTCRSMYIAVRNLPSILEGLSPRLGNHPLPCGDAWRDVAYWSDVGGIVWDVHDMAQLLELGNGKKDGSEGGSEGKHAKGGNEEGKNEEYRGKGGTEEDVKDASSRGSPASSTSISAFTKAALKKLFVALSWRATLRSSDVSLAEWQKMHDIFSNLGGLSMMFAVGFDFGEIPEFVFQSDNVGADSERGLRYVDVALRINKSDTAISYESFLAQLADHVSTSTYASVLFRGFSRDGVVTSMEPFRGFHSVAVSNIKTVQDLTPLVETCRSAEIILPPIRRCPLADLSPLGQLHTLDVSFGGEFTDVSMLGGVHTLALNRCDQHRDLSALGTVHSLVLRDCENITDVSPLRNLHSLKISKCPGLTDVSALSGLHTVDLALCNALTNVSPLGSVHSLSIRYCKAVTDFSGLGRVRTLEVMNCPGLTDVSALGTVHTLTLSMCENLSDVRAVGSVHELTLRSCKQLSDVSALGNVQTLTLIMLSSLTDVSALGNVHKLSVLKCVKLSSVAGLGTVHSLVFHECNEVTDVSPLAAVHTLSLQACRGVTDVTPLGGVHTLRMQTCLNVTDVSALGTVHTLVVSHTHTIDDVSALHSVERLVLYDCTRVTNACTLQGKVPLLTIFRS